jgi:UDP-N-acetylmuramate dehydrogenase
VRAVEFARKRNLPWFVLGGGSNVVAKGDYDGVIILNRIEGFEKLSEDETSATYRIGAGEDLDSIIAKLANLGLSGIESMSAIPGCAGSTPVQNVGAYGQEIADTLIELEAYDTDSDEFVVLSHDDCDFSYRNSIFKNPATRHHIIASITLHLRKKQLEPPFYPVLEKYLSDNDITDYSPTNIRGAVIAIRANKLPDPREIASAGSFFKNPIVPRDAAEKLLSEFPDAPHWEMPEGQEKLSAGWLIDQAGLKSYSSHGMQIYPKNALVVTNLNAQSADDLEQFKSEIIAYVKEKFNVILEQEPETL